MKHLLSTALCGLIFANGFDPAMAQEHIEITLLQNLSSETVECKSIEVLVDYSYYGHVVGTKCQSTAPLFQTPVGIFGHTTVDFTFIDGSTLSLSGCREDDHYDTFGFHKYSINCAY
jgi:hypothetical protein